jgi:tripartite-type tricarboxylate transporter receptor subunit TctC
MVGAIADNKKKGEDTMLMNPRAAQAAATLCLATCAVGAQAQEAYPTKPITVILGFAPGGPTDAIGRVVFARVGKQLNVPVIVENRPGAGSNLATQFVARAKPDGYTLLYAASSMAPATALYKSMNINPKTQLVAAGCSVSVPLILLTAQKTEAKDPAAFFASMASNPNKYFLGSSGTGSMDQLVAMEIGAKINVQFHHVPYRGNGPALTDVAAGTVDYMYSGAFNSAVPFIQNGQVRALAVTSLKRSPALPDVPTLSESVPGLKDYQAGTWQALLAPKDTPPAILDKLNAALQEAMSDPDVQKSLRFQAAEPMGRTRAQCQQFVNDEYDRWAGTIDRLGLKAD